MFLSRFLRDMDATDTNSGGEVEIAEPIEVVEPEVAPIEEIVVDKIDIPLAKLKDWGFESQAQMEEFFAKQKEQNKPDEDKQKEIEIENAKFRAFAIQEGNLKEEDFETHKEYTKAADKDLVFKKSFLPAFKEENPDIEDEDELLEAAQAEFESEYKTASAKRLAKEANEIRSEVVGKYNTAKENYEFTNKWEGGKKAWGEFVAKTMEEILPSDELVLFEGKDGEDPIKIDVKLTKEEKAEIFKAVVTPKRYAQFLEGKTDEVANLIKERVLGAAIQRNAKTAIQKAIEKGIEIGQKKSPSVGARNPFPLVDKKTNESGIPDKTLDDQIRESHQKAAARFQ